MSKKSARLKQNPILIGSSKLISLIIILATVICTISVFEIIFQWPWVGFLLPWISICTVYQWRMHARRTAKDAIVQCQWIDQDIWRLIRRSGRSTIARLQPGLYRSPWLMILSFQPIQPNRRFHLILANDAVAKQNYSELLSSTFAQKLHSL